MKVYLDLILILNFFFDFILLLSVSILLKRNANIIKIIIASFIGGLSILFLFIKINSLTLFIFKVLISVIMILVSFGYKSIKYTFNNLLYLYLSSIILGGFLYFLNVEFSYKQVGLVFFFEGLSINVVFLIVFSPIIIYLYIKQIKNLKNNYNNYYKVILFYNNKKFILNAFLDTGNNLVSPISNKPIILIDLKIDCSNYFLVPYNSINNGFIKCFKADIEINDKRYNKTIIGLLNNKIKIDGVNCLLNKKLLEE